MNAAEIKSLFRSVVKHKAGCRKGRVEYQPVTKDRKTGGLDKSARDHPVWMTGATERGEERREG